MRTGLDSSDIGRTRIGAAGVLREKHFLWLTFWVIGLGIVWAWDALFLNPMSFRDVQVAFFNSVVGGLVVVFFSFALGWAVGVGGYFLDRAGSRFAPLVLTFLFSVHRSVPQIVGILFGYVILTHFIIAGSIESSSLQLLLTALIISLFVFLEVADLVRERIEYYRRLDFFSAMLCCGIPEWRIVNVEILRENSRAHLIHKAVAVFGMAIFLQCSIDFIVSVGLSSEVSSTNFPTTLGNLLARLDSKQDILAISTLFTDPGYIGRLVVRHLQGISVAWTIVFTLLCNYKIANGLVRRYRL